MESAWLRLAGLLVSLVLLFKLLILLLFSSTTLDTDNSLLARLLARAIRSASAKYTTNLPVLGFRYDDLYKVIDHDVNDVDRVMHYSTLVRRHAIHQLACRYTWMLTFHPGLFEDHGLGQDDRC